MVPLEPQRPNGREAKDDNGGSTERRKRRQKEETKKRRRKSEETKGGTGTRACLYIDINVNFDFSIKNPHARHATSARSCALICACHRHLDQLQLLPLRETKKTKTSSEQEGTTARVSPILPQPTWSATSPSISVRSEAAA
ncbi:hypothetical protein HL42_4577 [Trichophyton rubrum]|nr:hypothetical protein HL42_4577 [Trichophyton rubrum]